MPVGEVRMFDDPRIHFRWIDPRDTGSLVEQPLASPAGARTDLDDFLTGTDLQVAPSEGFGNLHIGSREDQFGDREFRNPTWPKVVVLLSPLCGDPPSVRFIDDDLKDTIEFGV